MTLRLEPSLRVRIRSLLLIAFFATSLAGALCCLPSCAAQSGSASPNTPHDNVFDVASVHPAKEGTGFTSISPPNSIGFHAYHATLRLLIAIAYGIGTDQVQSKLSWLDDYIYDIDGKTTAEQVLGDDQLRPMLQALLLERFALQCHMINQTKQGYALSVLKKDHRLTRTSETTSTPMIVPGKIIANAVSMQTFAALLARPLGRPVIDRTFLEGNYNIDLNFASDSQLDSPLPPLVTALKEQYGLILVATKVAQRALIVDAANPVPISN